MLARLDSVKKIRNSAPCADTHLFLRCIGFICSLGHLHSEDVLRTFAICNISLRIAIQSHVSTLHVHGCVYPHDCRVLCCASMLLICQFTDITTLMFHGQEFGRDFDVGCFVVLLKSLVKLHHLHFVGCRFDFSTEQKVLLLSALSSQCSLQSFSMEKCRSSSCVDEGRMNSDLYSALRFNALVKVSLWKDFADWFDTPTKCFEAMMCLVANNRALEELHVFLPIDSSDSGLGSLFASFLQNLRTRERLKRLDIGCRGLSLANLRLIGAFTDLTHLTLTCVTSYLETPGAYQFFREYVATNTSLCSLHIRIAQTGDNYCDCNTDVLEMVKAVFCHAKLSSFGMGFGRFYLSDFFSVMGSKTMTRLDLSWNDFVGTGDRSCLAKFRLNVLPELPALVDLDLTGTLCCYEYDEIWGKTIRLITSALKHGGIRKLNLEGNDHELSFYNMPRTDFAPHAANGKLAELSLSFHSEEEFTAAKAAPLLQILQHIRSLRTVTMVVHPTSFDTERVHTFLPVYHDKRVEFVR